MTTPPCPYFGECGGCQYQDIPYEEELRLKEDGLRALFGDSPRMGTVPLSPIVPSPKQYHYRCRLDMNLLRIKSGELFLGFAPVQRGLKVMEIQACPLALEPLSDFIPQLKQEAAEKLTPKYRVASLVVKSGDDGRVFWGGIGKRSLRLAEEDYLFTELCGRRVYFSLDTFFQANLSILPALMKAIADLGVLNSQTVFYDLYGGVGLFGICFSSLAKRVVLVEENVHAIRLARYNAQQNEAFDFDIHSGRMEDLLAVLPAERGQSCLPACGPHCGDSSHAVAMIDPPRKGLSDAACNALAYSRAFRHILYLSCNPEALVRDLNVFFDQGWELEKVLPFDFFPQTRHIETLALLSRTRHG